MCHANDCNLIAFVPGVSCCGRHHPGTAGSYHYMDTVRMYMFIHTYIHMQLNLRIALIAPSCGHSFISSYHEICSITAERVLIATMESNQFASSLFSLIYLMFFLLHSFNCLS